MVESAEGVSVNAASRFWVAIRDNAAPVPLENVPPFKTTTEDHQLQLEIL